MSKIVVIGAGLGGLAVACRLARTGHSVTVIEKNGSVGGKVNLVESGGFSFDTGASLLTMKHVFEDLFEYCGASIDEFIDFRRLDPICRHFWSDRTVFDAASDTTRTAGNIRETFPSDEQAFLRYIEDSRTKYEIAERTFLAKSLNELPTLLKPSYLPDLFRISTLRTLDKHNSKYFQSPKLQQVFNRYATYNGSSPYSIPATFALIPHVEFDLGAWYPMGGMYQIPSSIRRLAERMGVVFQFRKTVSEIIFRDRAAKGVVLEDGESIDADIVVSNSDAIETYRHLVPKEVRRIYGDAKLDKIEPSCSGFVLLLGTNRKFDQLAHHNMFFSDDYGAEFDAIFKEKRPAANPSIYVCASSKTDPAQAPPGCENLFILVNAPYTSDAHGWGNDGHAPGQSGARWYGDLVIDRLESYGLKGLREAIDFREAITPEDFESRYRANRGSIYGVSSNGILSAFMRVPNKAKDLENLYFVGGTTHPGGGMPMVLLSGNMVAGLIG